MAGSQDKRSLKVAVCNQPTTHLVWYTLTFYT